VDPLAADVDFFAKLSRVSDLACSTVTEGPFLPVTPWNSFRTLFLPVDSSSFFGCLLRPWVHSAHASGFAGSSEGEYSSQSQISPDAVTALQKDDMSLPSLRVKSVNKWRNAKTTESEAGSKINLLDNKIFYS
jgi:hypothetical protein